MGDFEACPSCGKPVMGRTALLAHLEFSHQIVDPETHLQALEDPPDTARARPPLLVWGGAGVAVVVMAVVGALLLTRGSSGGATVDGAAAVNTTATESTTTSTTSAAPPETTTPTSAPTTTAPATTSPPTTDPPPTTEAPRAVSGGGAVAVEDFRKPFLSDAHVVNCSSAGGSDVYLVEFTLSGARDIVFDGVGYPDGTGDGERRIEHATASGTPTWLGHVDVADGGGTQHPVEIFPALYLANC